MNRPTAINLSSIPLATVLMLIPFFSHNAYAEKEALSSVTANSNSDDSGPVFLNFAQQMQKNNDSLKPAESTNNNTKTTNDTTIHKTKIVSQQSAIIAQKDKTIRQLQKQLDSRPAVNPPAPDNQKELVNKIKQLQEKLDLAAVEKQALIKKENSAIYERDQNRTKLGTTESKIQQQSTKIVAAESEKQRLEVLLAKATAEKQTLIDKLTVAETAQQTLTAQLSAAAAQKQDLAAKLTNAAIETQALTAKLDALTINKKQPTKEEETLRLQADKDKALLQAKTDEINRLTAKLAETQPTKKSAAIDLAQKSNQQAYAVGVLMGDEAQKVLSTRMSQGIKINQDVVLKGFADSFSGHVALDEKARNDALADTAKKVLQSQNKIEQKNLSEGKKYQQKFAKQKGVVFKDGVYSRIDYKGKGKILDSDTVTVTIKETLVDGTVINDMEAESKVWSQTLNAYPPTFIEPIKRLENHGAITIVIPADLAYGSEGAPPKIPPGATMIYSVRIVDVTAAQSQPRKP